MSEPVTPEPTTSSSPPKAPVANPQQGGDTAVWKGAFSAFGAVFDQVKKNPEPAYIYVGTYVALSILTALTKSNGNTTFVSYEGLANLIFLLALPTYALALADRKVISVGEFFRFDLAKFLYLFVAGLLFALIVGLSLIAFIIPAIWTIAWFAMYSFPVIDKNAGIIESLKESKRLAQNNKAKVWGVIGATIMVMVPALFISFIPYVGTFALALVGVLSTGVLASLYRHLQKTVVAAPAE
jgi:hypothetical protein